MSGYWIAAFVYVSGYFGWTAHGVWITYRHSRGMDDSTWRERG